MLATYLMWALSGQHGARAWQVASVLPLAAAVVRFGVLTARRTVRPVEDLITRDAVIRNRGSQTVRIFTLAVSSQRGGFALASFSDSCLGTPLSPGASCVQEVTFTPNRLGLHAGDFCVDSTDLTGVAYWVDCRRVHGLGTASAPPRTGIRLRTFGGRVDGRPGHFFNLAL